MGMLKQVTNGIRMIAVEARHLSGRVPRGFARIYAAGIMASAAVALGLLFTLSLLTVNVSEAALSEPVFLADYRGQAVAVIALVGLGLLIVAFLMERQARFKAKTEAAESHAELLRASRLAVMGQLSASIAHEINQPLGAILSNADAAAFMLAKADPDLDEVHLILADIRKDGLRASEVVRQVRSLARKREMEFVEVDLQDLCKDILSMIIPLAKRRGVTILTHFDPRPLRTRGDPVLLRQAMLNLLMNAMDALINVSQSRAVIEVHATSLRSEECEISVRDHGNGVPEPYLDKLFDAFFTTKTHGLGLGLPILRSIIESHGGRVLVENHPEGGAVFRCIIPTMNVASAADHPAEEPA